MKSYARILAIGCIAAFAASALSQTPLPVPAPKPVPVHHTDAEWSGIINDLTSQLQMEHAKFLKATMDLSSYKLDELSQERQAISGAMEQMFPGTKWDERTRTLQQAPAAPQAAQAPAKSVATPTTPASAPAPTPTAGKAPSK